MHLSGDVVYAERAMKVVEKVVDASELLDQFEFTCRPIRATVHTPCSLQHGQGIDGKIRIKRERIQLVLLDKPLNLQLLILQLTFDTTVRHHRRRIIRRLEDAAQ